MIFHGGVIGVLIAVLTFVAVVDGSSSAGSFSMKKIFMESTPNTLPRDDLVKTDRAAPEHVHELVFAVTQLNMDQLEAHLLDVSNPTSPRYGQHKTRAEVDAMTANPVGLRAIVDELRALPGATIVQQTPNGEYVVASATVAVWEAYLDTTFHVFEQTRINGVAVSAAAASAAAQLRGATTGEAATVATHKVVRCEQYSVPATLHPFVFAVLNTVQMPMHRGYVSNKVEPFDFDFAAPANAADADAAKKAADKAASASASGMYTGYVPSMANCYQNGTISPCRLKEVYKITGTGSPQATQGVFASLGSLLSPADLASFQNNFKLPVEPVATVIGTSANSDAACKQTSGGSGPCMESMLDVEYLLGVCPRSPTTFWYVDDVAVGKSSSHDLFVYWLLQVRLCPAWKCVQRVQNPSHPGTPTPSRTGCCRWPKPPTSRGCSACPTGARKFSEPRLS